MQPEAEVTLETARLSIRLVEVGDAEDLIAYDKRNASHLQPWEPIPDPAIADDVESRRSSVAKRCGEADAGRGYSFLGRMRAGDGTIVSAVNLNNIVRGVFQACHLGYSVDASHEGTGIAFEAVSTVLGFAFAELNLHRVMANYQPSNERSGRLLRRLGFIPEGYARDYLLINGGWRDHVLTSLVKP